MRTSRSVLSDSTYVGKNGKNKSFWFFVNNTYSPYLRKTRTHPKGKEYEDFVNELVRRRDALRVPEEALAEQRKLVLTIKRHYKRQRSNLAKTLVRLRAEVRKARGAFIEYRNLSIEMNFRFILKQAGHYSLKKVPKDRYHDLVQECVMGWMRGLETFDPGRSRLTTHCSYWIMQGVRRFVYHDDHVVHVPIYQYEKGVRLDPAYSLDAPKIVNAVFDPNGANVQSFADFLVDHEAPDPDENVHQMERAGLARSLLYTLDDRERDIVMRRFGMNGYGPDGETLDAIGKEYGLTRERVRQIEKKALDKIRDGVKRGSIKPTARPISKREHTSLFTVIQGGGE